MTEIAVLGAGNGGFAFAGYLGLQGHKVRLYETPQFGENLTEVKRLGGINVIGVAEGFGKVDLVTTDIEEAVSGVELILVVVPAYAHRDIALACAPYVKEGQVIVLNPGSSFGILEFKAALEEAGNYENITLAETSSNIFGCRKMDDETVNLLAVKNKMPVSSYPKEHVTDVVSQLKELFEEFEEAESVLETSLNNWNSVVRSEEAGNYENITLAETSSNIFGCRKMDDETVNLLAVKNKMPVSSYPKEHVTDVVSQLKELFEEFEEAESVLETSLNNWNSVV